MRAHRSPSGLRATAVLVALATFVANDVRAELDLGALSRASIDVPSFALPEVLRGPVSVVVELPEDVSEPSGFVPIAARLGVLDLEQATLRELARERPELRFDWAPPRRLLMDRADAFANASSFRNDTGLTGRGVVVGIVDSGVDPTHPDLRGDNGRSRILWWLDFSRGPAGRHPELEAALGCTGGTGAGRCAVLDGSDVEELLANDDLADDPGDAFGHGTHVASLAAGSGRAFDPARYVGVAPEASFIVVRAIRAGGGIFDADILKATRFVFERADELAMPAVVNLSLGSDFGGHDGSSSLELGLESFVGPAHPGRAIVVAAGNSAGLVDGITGVPGPCGVHTEVHVPRDERALVPIVTLAASDPIQATVYAWIATRPGDALSVGVVDPKGDVVTPVAPGRAVVEEHDGVTISIANDVHGGANRVPVGSQGAVVIIEGAWPSERTFGLHLEGPGSARVWVLGEGDLGPTVSFGPLVPRARKEGTINVPASSPGLIAVGATLNRTEWVDVEGEDVAFPGHGALDDAPPDTTAYFSSAGPNADGSTKPDLVASGANVVGAMARTADPRFTDAMLFSSPECLARGYSEHCAVVDDGHAVSSGTSMAAPLVSGAVALLFERDPGLDQTRVRALLQAGSRALAGVVIDERQVGVGALDLSATLDVLAADTDRLPGSATRLVLGASFAHPDSSWPLEGFALLRDDDGRVADGFDPARLSLAVRGADVRSPLERVEAGLFSFALAAPPGTGGRTLSVALRFDGQTLAERSVPVAVDPELARTLPSARGGCAIGALSRRGSRGSWVIVVLGAALARARRRPKHAEPRVHIEPPARSDAAEFFAAVRRSKKLHRSWVSPPSRPADYARWVARSKQPNYRAFLIRVTATGALAGVVNLSEIVFGNFRSAYMGYYAFEPHARRGFLAEGIGLVLDHAFTTLGLNRVEANVQPTNVRSLRLVRRLGFKKEGFSPKYLSIAGRLRDHVRTTMLAETWAERRKRALTAQPDKRAPHAARTEPRRDRTDARGRPARGGRRRRARQQHR
jgi:RimJ/RimL family protein N-acetyltransferase/subtilisin family serine protease